MNKHLPREDELPWYRQFWPWFLILMPTVVVVAALSTLFIASRHADDLVVDEYYRDGLAINRQLEKQHRAERLGMAARLIFSGETAVVLVSGPEEAVELDLLLSHPLESDRDFRLRLQRVAPGEYRGVLENPVAPRWHWTLQGPGSGGWRLDGTVTAHDIDDAASR